MENKALLEEIKRMHEIIGIKPNIISENSESVEESGIPGTSQFAKYLAKILVSDVITIGAKSYTKAEVRVILNKVGLRSLSTNEIAVVKEATSRAIAKDASKSVLNTIAKTFVNDLKAITDDAVAEAQYQEFKATFNTILKDTDAQLLDKNIKAEVNKIVRPIKPVDLTQENFLKLVKTIDGSKLKDYNKVTSEAIATLRNEHPTLGTTDLIKKILETCPQKTWTPEFILKVAGKAFDYSTEKAGQFAMFAVELGKKIPLGKTAGLATLGVVLYVAYKGIEEMGTNKNWSAFKKDLTKIVEKYSCLGDKNGNPKFVVPGDTAGEYIVKDGAGNSYPTIWKEDVLYYIDKKTKKITEPVSCPS
jgi:hypothetical protein